VERERMHGTKRPREGGQGGPSKKRFTSVPLVPLRTHDTKWTPDEARVTLNATLDQTITEDGESRCCNLVVLDNFFGEQERQEILTILTGQPTEGTTGEPPETHWERSTSDGKDLPVTYGPKGPILDKLCNGEIRAVREIWSRVSKLYPEYTVCLQPHNEYFIDPNQPTPKYVCWPAVGNAPVSGDNFRYHYDGDPASYPINSAWNRQFGSYVNHEKGKPLMASLLIYLCRHWRRDLLGETLFLDDATATGLFVRPKGYRAVLMDQDVLHRISAPSREAPAPRYSVVWKLVFLPKKPNQTCSLALASWARPLSFGSTALPTSGYPPCRGEGVPQWGGTPLSQRGGLPSTPAGSTPSVERGGNKIRGVPESQRTLKPPKVHAFTAKSQTFTVDEKYQPLNEIGQGAYGVVCAAMDTSTGTKVAIKKISKVFDDLIDGKRVLREIKLLRHFDHENVVGLYDLINPPSFERFTDMYIVLHLMETDLHKIINSKNDLSDDHIQYFVYQILRGLKYIHSAGVMHRDLKPSNILLNGNCDLKICDFGLARGVGDGEDGNLTEYVVTRWYRAPEVMCSCREYDHKIDVWSVGCIMAELLGRKPLFPGKDYIQQMNLIFNVIGSPTIADTSFITNKKALQYIQTQMEKREKIPLGSIYPKANPVAVDLLEKMLTFNPRRRISVQAALDHPYFDNLRVQDTETTCDQTFDREFEKMELTHDSLKRAMFDEIALFRPYIYQSGTEGTRTSSQGGGVAMDFKTQH